MEKWTYLSWCVWLRWQHEQIIDTVNDILGWNVFFAFLLRHDGSIHTHVGHTFKGVIVVLEHKSTTEGKDQILENVNGSFSAKHEVTILEKFPLFLWLILLYCQLLHLGRILKLMGILTITSISEQFTNMCLHLLNFGRVKVHWCRRDWVEVLHGVLESNIWEQFVVDKFD